MDNDGSDDDGDVHTDDDDEDDNDHDDVFNLDIDNDDYDDDNGGGSDDNEDGGIENDILILTTMTMVMMFISWTMYAAARLDEVMESLTMQWFFTPKVKQDQQVIAKAKAVADLCFDRIEHALKDRQFILGSE